MKKFIFKTVFFFILFILSFILLYFSSSYYLNRSFHNQNAVFVWGDSQAYRGIDFNVLSKLLNKKVYCSARPGAGVYDFLVFTERVPENSSVVVAISKLVQIRRKEKDFNRSGISIWGFNELLNNNYSLKEVYSIFKLNLLPRKIISESGELFSYSDSMKIRTSLNHFENYYEKVPSFLENKQNLYKSGIENLINKNCELTFIEFPFHIKLKTIENQSPIKIETEKFKLEIGELFDDYRLDSISINKEKNIFKDLSHLNSAGARDLSKKIALEMLKNDVTTMFIAQ